MSRFVYPEPEAWVHADRREIRAQYRADEAGW